MSERIIDHLQAIHVTDDNRKFIDAALFQGSVDLLLRQKKGMLALDAGQRIGQRDGFGLITLLCRLFLPFLHVQIIGKHNDEGQPEQADDDKHTGIVCIMKPVQLDREEFILFHFEHFSVTRSIDIT